MSNPFPTSKTEIFLIFLMVLGYGIVGIITKPFRYIYKKLKGTDQSAR